MLCRRFVFMLMAILSAYSSSKGCTIFNVSNDNTILVGNNEDYNLEANIWFIPASGNENGRVTFGWNNGWSQGGMNDKGLFFDWAATTETSWEYSSDRITYIENKVRGSRQVCEKIMAECSSVEEAIEIFKTYNVPGLHSSHPMFVDGTGKSAIIEWGNDELAVHHKDKNYQVLTNFNFINHNIGWYPCWRYNKVNSILSANPEPTIDLVRAILDSVHQEGQYYTVYSNIYDIKNNMIFVYNHYNFDEVLPIHVQSELSKGTRSFKLAPLFSNINMIYPAQNQTINSRSVTFQWTGNAEGYQLFCSTHPDFTDCQPIPVSVYTNAGMDYSLILLILPFFIVIAVSYKDNIKKKLCCILLVTGIFVLFCDKKVDTLRPLPPTNRNVRYTVNNLESNATYYWKIVPVNEHELKTESIVRNFDTMN